MKRKEEMTFDEIVDDLFKHASEELPLPPEVNPIEQVVMIQSEGRYIRNTYGLWFDNPLTANWRNNPEGRDIRNGIDYSKDHPDQVSKDIIVALLNKMAETDFPKFFEYIDEPK